MTEIAVLAALGLGVGFMSGLFGIGGGFLLTPILVVVMRLPAPIAVGSSLCQTIGMSIVSFLKHRELGNGEPRMGVVMLGGSLAGVDLGARLLGWLGAGQTLALEAVYLVLLGSIAAGTLWATRRKRRHARREGVAPLLRLRLPPYIELRCLGGARASIIPIAYIGLVVGVLSGLLGIGGGIVLLPVLVNGYGFSMRDAAGTGILLLFATVTIGTAVHAWHGHVDLRVALAILAGSSLGAHLGARATSHLRNRTLRIAFVALVLVTVTAIAVDLARALAARAAA